MLENKFNIHYYSRQYRPSFFHRRGDNPFVHGFWVRYIRKIKSGGNFLEIGCGEGYFLKRISSYFSAWGIDINKDGIDTAKKVATEANLEVSDAIDLPFCEDFFDIVVAFDVIEHLLEPRLCLKEAFRVLKKGGVLIIRTPNPLCFGRKVKSNLWSGCRDETHISIHDPEDWRRYMVDLKFRIIREGTDTLWDPPYFKVIPKIFQKIIFIGSHQFFNLIGKGFFKWSLGENWVCIAKK